MSELPETEAVAQAHRDLDLLSSDALVEYLIDSQCDVIDAVLAQREAITGVVDRVVARLRDGGRLHYVGAGTSGRLAMLDAAEMPPTFGTEPGLVDAHVAGGSTALVRAVEGAEDDAAAGEQAVHDVTKSDAVIGISASGGAVYVVAAIASARKRGAFTTALVNSDASPLAAAAERAIVVRTGAEPIAGSTRMRAGTAQKVVLNTISSAAMVLLGRVHENLMIDVIGTNKKLQARALRLVQHVAAVDEPEARRLLDAANGSVKVAIVIARHRIGASEARALLERHNGLLRDALS